MFFKNIQHTKVVKKYNESNSAFIKRFLNFALHINKNKTSIIMKNCLFLLLLILSSVSIAQKSHLKDAEDFFEEGELQKAEKSINLSVDGVDDDKIIDDPETWLIRGNIYTKIYSTPAFTTDIEKELTEAAKSYSKALTLADKEMEGKGRDHKLRPDILAGLKNISQILSKEAKAYHALNKYETELKLLKAKMSLFEHPNALSKDMQTVMQAGIAAKMQNRVDEAIGYFDKVIEAKHRADKPYVHKAEALKMKKEYKDMIAAIEKGAEAYPATSGELLAMAIDYYTKRDMMDKCETYLNGLSEKHAGNVEIEASKGYFYLLKGNKSKANELCKNALQTDPENYLTNYYMGLLYYDKAMEIQHEADTQVDDIMQVIHEQNPDVVQQLKLALPLMEKAHKLNPENKDVINKLIVIYRKLDMFVKSMDLKKLSEKLGYSKL